MCGKSRQMWLLPDEEHVQKPLSAPPAVSTAVEESLWQSTAKTQRVHYIIRVGT